MIYSRGLEPSSDRQTLVDILENRADQNPALPLFTFLEEGEHEQGVVTAAELAMQARSIAVWLEQHGLGGQRILLLFPQGLAFIASFFGCVYAGAIAIPSPMPDPSRVARTLPRLQGILADAAPAAVLTNRAGLGMAAEVVAHLPDLTKNLQWLAFEDCPWDLGSSWRRPQVDPDNPAHLQYTSGSTALPKGTMITHANIIANSRAIQKACRYTPDSRSVVWEPYFHDDGLIQGIIQPVFTGFPCMLMAPSALVARPDRWLRAISRYRATHTCGPNFAYELCRRKVTDEQRQGLDLSSLVHAQNAAEPVRAETLRKFFERFEVCGLRWNALSPNYGMAEATLMVTSSLRDSGPVIQSFDAVVLEREGKIRPVSDTHPNARLLASSGAPLPETVVAIADPNSGERYAADRVGEILVKSPGVAAGYFRRPEESERTFQARLDDGDGPYLRTGDQGFLFNGDLFVTGRIKDLIIIRGENRYPQDIELSVERSHPAISPGSIAAFSIESDNEERLAVVAEIKRGSSVDPTELFIAIRDAISTEHDLRPGAIALLAPGTLPKTSSGKIQRQASRKAFLEGTLQEVARWTDTKHVESSAERTLGISAGKSSVAIQEWLSRYLATELGMRPGEISLDIPFSGYGMDSTLAVRLAADLGEWLGLKLPPVIAWNYPNIRALSQHLGGAEDVRHDAESRVSPDEPIAIIGAACRFPGGVRDLESFWRLLDGEVDAITDVPRDRWDIESFYDPDPESAGKMVSRWGGFLGGFDEFEPAFFEISPREAAEMDPQQRILLEVGWEALERAGQTLSGLRGSNTGVYVGISSNEYQQIGLSSAGLLNPHLFLGTTHSTGVARLSYWLGLQGPNMPVNTACSSSLVAVDLACQALRNGECSMALAGGVNLILSPETTVCLSQMRALSPTGRCHSFSADADGYVRSEGCGIVVLKRLSDAERDGDSILAIIRGTSVNQDGRSNGLTAPHGPAQEDVIRRALANASVAPRDVDYVETHGTGTPLGDPIEAQALANVLGEGRNPDKPLVIGSVKTNIGHAESAAGIAGLLKVVLALAHKRIPRSLHFKAPNPHVPWTELPVRVAASAEAWIEQDKPRLAAVSSFGFSGTNAHVILEEAPRREIAASKEASHYLLPLSAKSPEALMALAKSYQEWISVGNAALPDIAYTASLRRSHFEYRLGVVGGTKEELTKALGAFAAGETPAAVVTGKVGSRVPEVIFVFSGQGSQWVGMGRELYRDEPVFREMLTRCDGAIRDESGISIVEELDKPEGTSRIQETLVAQPALFAIEVALSALLQSWGVVPSAVIGHSVGEIAAAHVAGMLDLAQAARLVCIRARVMQKATGHGKMVSVSLPEEAAGKAIAGFEAEVGIAAVNDPNSVVLSGDIEGVDSVVEKLSQQGVQVRPLRVNYAFHSPQMAPLVAEFVEALGELQVKPATIPMFSTVTGEAIAEGELDVGYWGRNIRQTVRFAEAIVTSNEHVFVEVGPHPVLALSIEQTLIAKNVASRVIPTLRRDKDERQHALLALGALHTLGLTIDWQRFFPEGGRVVELPTYP
ncbi:MAG TPA: beta-ketoacyl synthase N-terminal-like domain-containing protein, partial [Polyangium sp.]|nr:beta-ketoacyl synthase N-terminal-like domain-containing protein [Polyangium sp.]